MQHISNITNQNQKVLELAYILSMTIAFTTRYGDLLIGYKLQIIIGMIWIFIGYCKFAKNDFKLLSNFKHDYPKLLKVYLTPHFLIHVYTILLMMAGEVNWGYFSTNLTVYVPTLLAIISIYIIGTRAYSCAFIALISSWILSIGISFLLNGPEIFIHAIRQAYFDPYDKTGGLTTNYLELHDLVLSIGYILIYYVFSNSKLTKRNFISLLIVLLIMTLGMKRISVLGVVIAVFFHFFVNMLSEKKRYKFCYFSGICAFAICYLFIYVLNNGDIFYDFLSSYGINAMGRNYYYKAIMDYSTFSPTFIGIGRNVITIILNSELSYLRVGGVHSDIIKMYVENGFIVFGFWLWYYLIYILAFYKKCYSIKSAVLYFGITIYLFTLYLTDNVEIYFISQFFSTLIPITFALKEKENIIQKY